ncbi:MAG: hypothetical protein HY533_00970 [Chloroflexi bacterium]|nr:hypothetical protein [Chloroflexota bacterium]
MNEEQPLPKAKSLDVIYSLAIRQLDEQLKELENVDSKLGIVMGASSVVLGLLLATMPTTQEVPRERFLFLIPPGMVYIVSVLLGIWAYRFLFLRYPPAIGHMYEDALFWDPEITKRQVLSNWVEAIDYNESLIARKVKVATFTLYLLPVEVVWAIVAGVLIHLP